jgi:uncharacterized protein YbjT (DUF2867 family)
VGRHVVRELLGRGYRVRAFALNHEKARAVLPDDDRVELADAGPLLSGKRSGQVDRAAGRLLADAEPDLRGPGAWGETVAGCEACINTIGIIREERGRSFRSTHVDATRHIVEACEAAGVGRYVQISAFGVRPEGVSEYQRSKFEGEAIVRESDLGWTIFRPGFIHGEGSEFVEYVKGWATGRRAPFLFMPYFTRGKTEPALAPVSVLDVAWACAEALVNNETIGEVYNLMGPDVMTWPELLTALRDEITNAKPGIAPRGMPGEVGAKMASAAKLVGMRDALPYDEGMALMATEDSLASLDKARADFGFEPRGFAEALVGYADAL